MKAILLTPAVIALAAGAPLALAGDDYEGGAQSEKEQEEMLQREAEPEEAEKAAEEAEKAAEEAEEAAEEAETHGEEMEQEGVQPEREPQAETPEPPEATMQVRARVLGVEDKSLVLDVQGVAVPVKVDRETQVAGEKIPRTRRISSHLEKEFEPGQMVNVAFAKEELENVAASIERLGGAPGAQPEGQPGQQQQQPGQQQQPEQQPTPGQ